jgi:tRNA (guanine-N(7)-)-methyltransferase
MSRRRKLEKFAHLSRYSHVFEMTEVGSSKVRQSRENVLDLRGRWKKYVFNNDKPLILELACGRGEYTLGLASLHPAKNFMGVDIKGARIYQGAKISDEQGISNVAFLRIRIEQLKYYFAPGEIDGIWITFPDPFSAKPNRRLTAPSFLDQYADLLSTDGFVNLKTDDDDLYDFSVMTSESHSRFRIESQSQNIFEVRKSEPALNIMTYYEKKHLANNKTIKYLHLRLND